MSPVRCAVAAETVGEPLAGTASVVSAYLLVEAPGPWGFAAVRDARLPTTVRSWLASLERDHGVRPLLVRRPRRRATTSARIFLGKAGRWLASASLSDLQEISSLDLRSLGDAPPPGLEPYDGPLVLVCTHGRHDPCCAERGRPLAAALAALAQEETWEVSHLGGDRFAGNVLVLPDGLSYGRLAPADAPAFVDLLHAGRLDLAHLRGRSSYPFAVQAAEIALRQHLGEDRRDALTLVSRDRSGPGTTAVFDVAGARWAVRIIGRRAPERRLTCHAATSAAPLHHEVERIENL